MLSQQAVDFLGVKPTGGINQINQDLAIGVRCRGRGNFIENFFEAWDAQCAAAHNDDVVSLVRPIKQLGLDIHFTSSEVRGLDQNARRGAVKAINLKQSDLILWEIKF